MATPTKQRDITSTTIDDLSEEKVGYLHKRATARQEIAKYDKRLEDLEDIETTTPTKKMRSTTKSDLAVRKSQYKAQRAVEQAKAAKYDKMLQDVTGRINKLRADYTRDAGDMTSAGPGFTAQRPRAEQTEEMEVSPTGTLGIIGKVFFPDIQPSVDVEDDLFAYLASDAYKNEHKQKVFDGYQLFAVGGFERGVTVYKNPVTDTMVFAIRGTRFGTWDDHMTWLPIAVSDEKLRTTKHFQENKKFVDNMLTEHNPTNIIYTGHSLGGSESIAMLEDGKRGRAVVFNPGIGVGWTKEEFEGLDIKLYATKFDITSMMARTTSGGSDILQTATELFPVTKIVTAKSDITLYHYMDHFLNDRINNKLQETQRESTQRESTQQEPLGNIRFLCFLPPDVGVSLLIP